MGCFSEGRQWEGSRKGIALLIREDISAIPLILYTLQYSILLFLLCIPLHAYAVPLEELVLGPTALTHDKQKSGVDKITSKGNFRLGVGNNGANPAIEPVTVVIGPFSTTIPVNSFVQKDTKTKTTWIYNGSKNALTQLIITKRGDNWTFAALATGLTLTIASEPNPFTVNLRIGDDSGAVSQFFAVSDTRQKLLLKFPARNISTENLVDVSGQVSVRHSDFVFNEATKSSDTVAILTNSLLPISAPVLLVITSISPSKVTLANVSGSIKGKQPFLVLPLPSGSLLPGQSISDVMLTFHNPKHADFTFNYKVLADVQTKSDEQSVTNIVDASGKEIILPGVATLKVPPNTFDSAAIELAVDSLPIVDELIKDFPGYRLTALPRLRIKSSAPLKGPVDLTLTIPTDMISEPNTDLELFALVNTELGPNLEAIGGSGCGIGAFCVTLFPGQFQPDPIDPVDPVIYLNLVAVPVQPEIYSLWSVQTSTISPVRVDLSSIGTSSQTFALDLDLRRNFSFNTTPITDPQIATGSLQGRLFVNDPFLNLRRNPVTGIIKHHAGLDLRTRDLPPGNADISRNVLSVLPGNVVQSGLNGGYGNSVKIQHENLATRYGHLANVSVGAPVFVNGGDLVGNSDSTGNSTGPHLHFELHYKNRDIDPRPILLDDMSLFLLPPDRPLLPSDPPEDAGPFPALEASRMLRLVLRGGGPVQLLDSQRFDEFIVSLFFKAPLSGVAGSPQMKYGVVTPKPTSTLTTLTVQQNGDATIHFQSHPVTFNVNDLQNRLNNLNQNQNERLKVDLELCTFRLGWCHTVHSWEIKPQFTLYVTINPSGSGAVTSVPQGINCPSGSCSFAFNQSEMVSLGAAAAPGFQFTGWSGDCSGTNPSITVTMNADKSCIASFSVHCPELSGVFSLEADHTDPDQSVSWTVNAASPVATGSFTGNSEGTSVGFATYQVQLQTSGGQCQITADLSLSATGGGSFDIPGGRAAPAYRSSLVGIGGAQITSSCNASTGLQQIQGTTFCNADDSTDTTRVHAQASSASNELFVYCLAFNRDCSATVTSTYSIP